MLVYTTSATQDGTSLLLVATPAQQASAQQGQGKLRSTSHTHQMAAWMTVPADSNSDRISLTRPVASRPDTWEHSTEQGGRVAAGLQRCLL